MGLLLPAQFIPRKKQFIQKADNDGTLTIVMCPNVHILQSFSLLFFWIFTHVHCVYFQVDDPFAKVQTANVETEEEERAEDAVKVDTVDTAAGELGDIVDLAIIVVIFFISCVTVVGVCVIVILAGYKVGDLPALLYGQMDTQFEIMGHWSQTS